MKRRVLAVTATAVVVLGVGATVFIVTGAYNVAATTPHARVTHWFMHTVMQRSVAARARAVPAPPSLDTAMVTRGFAEYAEMCVDCHGAPGVERGVLGKGINPEPPDLAKESGEWSDRELFWITKHGIKMAGMPAFGVTHSDTEIWGIVAAMRRLQYMSAEEYRRSVAAAGAHRDMHGIVSEAGGETQPAELEAHAHDSMRVDRPQRRERAQDLDHSRMAHSRTITALPARTRADMSEHDEHRRPPTDAAANDAADTAAVDLEGTARLKAFASELLRDPIVLERIRSDSALRHRWENPRVRSQLARPP